MPIEILRRLRRPAGSVGRRISVNWPGELRFLRMRRACVVLDVSSSGAQVLAEGVPHNIREMRLILEMGPPIAAAIAWRMRDRIGLCFSSDQEWVVEFGRRRSDSADWVG